ncbi:hypothetical protein ACOSP7_004852 [Xanthoceras sorbifolium]
MGTLTTLKFDGSRTMHEHVIEMTNIATKLKSLGMNVDENFLIQFIINSLPSEHGLKRKFFIILGGLILVVSLMFQI